MRTLLLAILVASVWAEWPEAVPVEHILEEEKQPEEDVLSLVSNGNDNFFDYMGIGLKELFQGIEQLQDKDLGLNSTTESGFDEEIENHMRMVKSDLCGDYSINNECSGSPIMGCKCHGHFGKIENARCRKSPCFIAEHIWGNAAAFLSAFRYVKDVEDIVNLGVKFANPIMKMMCECNPTFYEATINCVKSYDGEMLEKKHRKGFRKVIKKIKLDALKNFLSTMTGAYCGDNASCMADFNGMVLHLAEMLDRSVAGEQSDKCNNFRRMSDTIMALMHEFMNKEKEHSLDRMLFRITDLPQKFWCGEKDCNEYLSTVFNNNCCFRDALKKFDLKLLKTFLKYVESVFKVSGSRMPKISKRTLKKIVKVADPVKTCKKSYKAQCDEP